MKVTLGGNRLGSGKKMVGKINNYFRSTHNLSEKFASSLAPGVLYPCMCKLAMRGDSFDISMDADARTIPTVGPLFGAFKMQLDIFQVPIRLYQGILHNNPIDIGLKMGQVYFPTLEIVSGKEFNDGKMNESCLLKYLGLSGIGTPVDRQNAKRNINAIPALAYYDIFKTYYANKQEDNAYVITGNAVEGEVRFTLYERDAANNNLPWYEIADNVNYALSGKGTCQIRFYANNRNWKEIVKNNTNQQQVEIKVSDGTNTDYISLTANDILNENWTWNNAENFSATKIIQDDGFIINLGYRIDESTYAITNNAVYEGYSGREMSLVPFALKNIDNMRYALLSKNELGSKFKIGALGDWSEGSGEDETGLPYYALVDVDGEGKTLNKRPMNGLVLKTYQNDIFNNWLNTDWIEGENGINELTKVTVTDGKFSMDALNFAEKLYTMLNRIAVAGATYEAWQDVVYEQVKRKQVESPIFCGGMSRELMFDEVLQTTPTEGKPLGTIGGRGRLIGRTNKGGKVHIRVDEASFIIGIISLTPRIFYTQGNEFYLTDVMSMDDIHKPAMDGIGFQDLIGERMAWWDTVLAGGDVMHRSKIGKLPAWIEYMTSIDRAYGDFAKEGENDQEGANFMILSRRYERGENSPTQIMDASTYIDPSKYNYAFADASLTAQNFWIEIVFNIEARRLMSARIIPNV